MPRGAPTYHDRVADIETRVGLERCCGIVVSGVTWHNVINPGDGDHKLHSLYAPTSAPARDRPPDQGGGDAAEH